jgi:tetratricopeptide (TPR) repeat protein
MTGPRFFGFWGFWGFWGTPRRCRVLAWLVAIAATWTLGAPAAPARADNDAGTESVFAHGAGNRAAAMGGAFVAAADDASAMIWNPAGLGLMARAELQAVQSGDLGLGMSESYAAVALPSWRWGGAGMVFRHFGVGGIEQRDDRNVLLADDLRDSQFELAVGYGRAWGEAWSVGGALKLQHQALAGFSGSGLGVDLGANVRPAAAFGIDTPWMQGLSWGLALRNAVAPAVRLDRESVADPLSLRTGLAWRTLLPTGGGLLTELDVSRAAGVSPRLHAGVEYQVVPAASLRLGLDGGMLTAGTGVRWRDLVLDYAFEDNALEPAHRAGVTLRFGSTTDESRIAYRKREDANVERRLAEAFRQRQAEQVTELLKRATEARARGDFDGALEALALVATLEPGRADAAALELGCLTDRARNLEHQQDFAAASLIWERALSGAPGDTIAAAGVQRCRAESDRRARRNTEIRALFAGAMDAFANDDWTGARTGFRAVLNSQPGDAEAARMLSRTEQAIARRVASLAAQAMRAVRSGDWDLAQARITEAQSLDRDAPGIAQAAAALARAREAEALNNRRLTSRADSLQAALQPVQPARPQLSARELEDLYQRGLAALRAQRSDDALRYWELVWSARPDYREVAGYLEREYLTRGMEAFAAGRLDEAVAQWERVLRVDPRDERARGYLARAQEQRNRSREILGGGP